ncbi:potassium-transporting ATPase subunit F [Gulosibacter bifidus]|uniref:Potassium-transporting ATPase subunit F n=1 Tax=Gulosibacter bifidus TaxID=272239 RepID=A0ABW5RJ44_9MICO|nr:potassium-transporting ATPase subunit F [Gulosibacter bifidus]
MIVIQAIATVLALGAIAYLVYALVKPEKF